MTDPRIDFIGCSITDEVYDLDPSIAGKAIMWNITRIRKDAEAGLFGPPIRRPMSVIPPQTAAHTANIDWPKVLRFCQMPDVLAKPVLSLDCEGERHIVDGNCRLCARQRLGMLDFETFIAPSDLERAYRVVILADGKEITLPFD
jgi:hypothetical protein